MIQLHDDDHHWMPHTLISLFHWKFLSFSLLFSRLLLLTHLTASSLTIISIQIKQLEKETLIGHSQVNEDSRIERKEAQECKLVIDSNLVVIVRNTTVSQLSVVMPALYHHNFRRRYWHVPRNYTLREVSDSLSWVSLQFFFLFSSEWLTWTGPFGFSSQEQLQKSEAALIERQVKESALDSNSCENVERLSDLSCYSFRALQHDHDTSHFAERMACTSEQNHPWRVVWKRNLLSAQKVSQE